MKLETATAILNWEDDGDIENFDEVSIGETTGKSRWHSQKRSVYRDKRDGKHWAINWHQGLTEMQDNGPEHISVEQVWPHQVTITVFKNEPPVGA